MGSLKKPDKLKPLLRDAGHLWIVMQDYPDPDAIASAAALRELARQRFGLGCTLVCGGVVGRVENRALLRYLDLPLRPFEADAIAENHRIALVDTQPGTGNNCLPETIVPHIVIDHHPINPITRRAMYTDIRRRYGATSTILYEYLLHYSVPLTPPLATALLYGIRSDTQDLGRESIPADLSATLTLFTLANIRMYHNIRHASLATPYFRLLVTALNETYKCGPALVAIPGIIDTPDAIGEIADMLLRHEDCQWALSIGWFEDRYLLSLRTIAPKADAGKVMQRLLGKIGNGGGHRMMAGGQIKPNGAPPVRDPSLEKDLMRRFLKIVACGTGTPRRLLA